MQTFRNLWSPAPWSGDSSTFLTPPLREVLNVCNLCPGGQQRGCGRGLTAADSQGGCSESEQRAAAQLTGSHWRMTAIHLPLQHHMDVASYSAQHQTQYHAVSSDTVRPGGGERGTNTQTHTDNLHFDLDMVNVRSRPEEKQPFITANRNNRVRAEMEKWEQHFWFSPQRNYTSVSPCCK